MYTVVALDKHSELSERYQQPMWTVIIDNNMLVKTFGSITITKHWASLESWATWQTTLQLGHGSPGPIFDREPLSYCSKPDLCYSNRNTFLSCTCLFQT